METAGLPLQCSACRTIDRADGVEDGRLYSVVAARVKNEMRIFRALRDVQDRIAATVTSFAGSMKFVYMHSVWFFIWIAFNLGFVSTFVAFDKFPFGLLTMIVSLEAIFLSTFVMVSQNRQAERADVRSQLDFETNLRSEIWSVHIGQALGIDVEHVEEVVRRAIAGSKQQLGG